MLQWTLNMKVKVAQSCLTLKPHGLYSPWNSPGQNTGVGRLSLLQGIFPTRGSSPGLPHCRWILYQLSHKGSPRILEWVAYPFSSGSSWPRNQTRFWIAGGFFTNWAMREMHIYVCVCVYIYVFELVFLFSLGIYPEVKLLDYMTVLFLIFWRLGKLVPVIDEGNFLRLRSFLLVLSRASLGDGIDADKMKLFFLSFLYGYFQFFGSVVLLSVLQSVGSQRVGTTEQLNWTVLLMLLKWTPELSQSYFHSWIGV